MISLKEMMLKYVLLENKPVQSDIFFLEVTLTPNFRVYSFQDNTKLYAKNMNAIFGDPFYRRYILKMSKNLDRL